ncbi:hypothetical protein P0136_12080 [Lentisphaerota bacterium ZTH]|nr:hypothetical protein JYG24_10405 [Lentisphaerota bacterium]WET06096.1 hypothetical protein P0136_12080 [Lentisphaerota bacterium ZTH]
MKLNIYKYLQNAATLDALTSANNFSNDQRTAQEMRTLHAFYASNLNSSGKPETDLSLLKINQLNKMSFPGFARHDGSGYVKYRLHNAVADDHNASMVSINIRNLGIMQALLRKINTPQHIQRFNIISFKLLNVVQACVSKESLIFYCRDSSSAKTLCNFLRETFIEYLTYWAELPPIASHCNGIGWITQCCSSCPSATPENYLTAIVAICLKAAHYFQKSRIHADMVNENLFVRLITVELLKTYFNYDLERTPHVISNEPQDDFIRKQLNLLFSCHVRNTEYESCVMDQILMKIKSSFRMPSDLLQQADSAKCHLCRTNTKRYTLKSCCLCGHSVCSVCSDKSIVRFSAVHGISENYMSQNGSDSCILCYDLLFRQDM